VTAPITTTSTHYVIGVVVVIVVGDVVGDGDVFEKSLT
jgi:hypothetical protein